MIFLLVEEQPSEPVNTEETIVIDDSDVITAPHSSPVYGPDLPGATCACRPHSLTLENASNLLHVFCCLQVVQSLETFH